MSILQLPPCTNGDAEQAFEVIWAVLNHYANSEIEGVDLRSAEERTADEEQWDEITTAMAWIREATELPGEVEAEGQPEMLVNTWAHHLEDGMIYRLVRCTPEEVLPWRFSLECCSDWHHVFGGKFSADEEIVEVCETAFNDFDHLCAFAKEVAAILHCEPATIVRAI